MRFSFHVCDLRILIELYGGLVKKECYLYDKFITSRRFSQLVICRE